MALNVLCNYTRVRNGLSVARHFGYLRRYGLRIFGKTLQAGQELDVEGDLRGNIAHDPRAVAALNADLLSGALDILATPQDIIYDPIKKQNSMLQLSNGVVTIVAPCWGEFVSSAGA